MTIFEEVTQGDIFEDLPIVHVDKEAWTVVTRSSLAILLTRSCEYDKPSCKTVHVAPVYPLSAVTENARGNIRAGKVRNTFYLAEQQGVLAESYVDLRWITTLDKAVLQQAPASHQRIVSLVEQAQEALRGQIIIFFGATPPWEK